MLSHADRWLLMSCIFVCLVQGPDGELSEGLGVPEAVAKAAKDAISRNEVARKLTQVSPFTLLTRLLSALCFVPSGSALVLAKGPAAGQVSVLNVFPHKGSSLMPGVLALL